MSTRATIGFARGKTPSEFAHLFEECLDADKVWLEVSALDLDASVEVYKGGSVVIVGVDIGQWRELVASWVASEWAQHPERDHAPFRFDAEGFDALVAAVRSVKSEKG